MLWRAHIIYHAGFEERVAVIEHTKDSEVRWALTATECWELRDLLTDLLATWPTKNGVGIINPPRKT